MAYKILSFVLVLVLLLALCCDNREPRLIYFSKTGCPHCTSFDPVWRELTATAPIKCINIKDNDCAKYRDLKGVPTIRLYKGSNIYEYNGNRTVNDINVFISSVLA